MLYSSWHILCRHTDAPLHVQRVDMLHTHVYAPAVQLWLRVSPQARLHGSQARAGRHGAEVMTTDMSRRTRLGVVNASCPPPDLPYSAMSTCIKAQPRANFVPSRSDTYLGRRNGTRFSRCEGAKNDRRRCAWEAKVGRESSQTRCDGRRSTGGTAQKACPSSQWGKHTRPRAYKLA